MISLVFALSIFILVRSEKIVVLNKSTEYNKYKHQISIEVKVMSIFFSYFFLGISLSAPIGPINAAQIDRGIKNGFMHSWTVGLGAMMADVLYIFAVYMGVVQFLEIPIVKTFLWLFGFFVLIYSGIECILGAGKLQENTRSNKGESIVKSFFSGFFMSIIKPFDHPLLAWHLWFCSCQNCPFI